MSTSSCMTNEQEVKQVWEIREGGVGHTKIPGEHPGWPSWEDAAVAPERSAHTCATSTGS